MKVNEIMCKDVAWCSLSSSAVAAASIMQERNVGILPVAVDAFTPVLVAVVTDRDLCLYAVAAGKDPAHVWVSGCATHDPVFCAAESDVRQALELMAENHIRRLPVVNVKHEIVGVISLSDIIAKGNLRELDVVSALKRIFEPGQTPSKVHSQLVTAA
jgi:CBS domain-containing protein